MSCSGLKFCQLMIKFLNLILEMQEMMSRSLELELGALQRFYAPELVVIKIQSSMVVDTLLQHQSSSTVRSEFKSRYELNFNAFSARILNLSVSFVDYYAGANWRRVWCCFTRFLNASNNITFWKFISCAGLKGSKGHQGLSGLQGLP